MMMEWTSFLCQLVLAFLRIPMLINAIIGSFHATTKGIPVVASAGNDGPFSQTTANTAPWLITVAATTVDRVFPIAITLGNNHTLMVD